jgi:uncharacterized protein (DUF2141 family)
MRSIPSGLRLLIAALALSGVTALAQADEGAPITVTISGLRYSEGVVHVDVCTRETFLRSTCPYSATGPAQIGDTTVTVDQVPPGVYAIQAFHDFKETGSLDQGPLGIPREGIAFSRDAPLGLSGPSFDRAAFTHGNEPQTLRLRLHRFKKAPPNPPPAGPG